MCKHVLNTGNDKGDRTGTGTLSIFGYQTRYDLSEGFPLVTTKDMNSENKDGVTRVDMIIEELLWFLRGETNIKPLLDKYTHIWNRDAYKKYVENSGKLSYDKFIFEIKHDEKFAEKHGDLGSVYGKQWRSWNVVDSEEVIDQISEVIESLKNDPDSRRHLVSAWNVADVYTGKMTLPPCHVLFQFYVVNGRLSCQLYQRSADIFLGVPFNIASYALLTMLIADEVGLGYGEFIHTLGDAHIYKNHIPQIKEQIQRQPKPLPVMLKSRRFVESIFDYKRDDFILVGYDPHPELKGKQSV